MKLYFATCRLVLVATVLVAEASKIKNPRLVNGEAAEEGQFPWQVGVVNYRDNLLQYCSGAIISEDWILTSAHCIYNADILVVIYGTLDLEDTDNSLSLSDNYVVHQNYDNRTLNNDIGLILLNSSLQFNDKVQPIALADTDHTLDSGVEVTVSGWGHTKDDDPSDRYDVLRYVSLTTIDNEECVEVYGPGVISSGVVCTEAGTPVRNPCEGDGGDPMVVYGDAGLVHVALFSFVSSYGCESSFPAGFTRTGYYRDWIREVSGI